MKKLVVILLFIAASLIFKLSAFSQAEDTEDSSFDDYSADYVYVRTISHLFGDCVSCTTEGGSCVGNGSMEEGDCI